MGLLTVWHHLFSQALFMTCKDKTIFQKTKLPLYIGFVFHILMTNIKFHYSKILGNVSNLIHMFLDTKRFSPSLPLFLPPFLPLSLLFFLPFLVLSFPFWSEIYCLTEADLVVMLTFPPKQDRIIPTIISLSLSQSEAFIKVPPFTWYILFYKAVTFMGSNWLKLLNL